MNSWAIVAMVAIAVWGVVQMARAKHGIVSKHRGEHIAKPQSDPKAQRELEELRERIKVLERIATDGNSLDASETKRISAEIEALRDKQGD